MLSYHQWHNALPFIATIISFYIWLNTASLIGYTINLAGLIVWWIAKIQLGDAFSILPKAKKLVTFGIYKRVRHPIYWGFSLTFIGWSVILNSKFLAVLSVLIIIFFVVRAGIEERILAKKFGKQYLDYKRKTWL